MCTSFSSQKIIINDVSLFHRHVHVDRRVYRKFFLLNDVMSCENNKSFLFLFFCVSLSFVLCLAKGKSFLSKELSVVNFLDAIRFAQLAMMHHLHSTVLSVYVCMCLKTKFYFRKSLGNNKLHCICQSKSIKSTSRHKEHDDDDDADK